MKRNSTTIQQVAVAAPAAPKSIRIPLKERKLLEMSDMTTRGFFDRHFIAISFVFSAIKAVASEILSQSANCYGSKGMQGLVILMDS